MRVDARWRSRPRTRPRARAEPGRGPFVVRRSGTSAGRIAPEPIMKPGRRAPRTTDRRSPRRRADREAGGPRDGRQLVGAPTCAHRNHGPGRPSRSRYTVRVGARVPAARARRGRRRRAAAAPSRRGGTPGSPPIPRLPSSSSALPHRPAPGTRSNTDRSRTDAPRPTWRAPSADGVTSSRAPGRPAPRSATTWRPGPQPTSRHGPDGPLEHARVDGGRPLQPR